MIPEHASGSGVEAFIQGVRGHPGEFGFLLQLAGRLGHHAAKTKLLAKPQRACLEAVRARVAELSRASERTMREAAVAVGQIGKALQEQKAGPETARAFGPILVVLQKRIDHSTRKVQAAKSVVQGLNRMLAAPERTAEERAAAPPEEATAPRRRRTARRTRRVPGSAS